MRAAPPVHAHAEALRGDRTLPPVDPGVPQLRDLLRREVMAPVLARSLRGGCDVGDVRVTLADYRPGAGATIAYDVAVAGTRRIAVASAGHALRPEAARTDARRAVARALGGASPVARPLLYDVGLGAVVQWYPLDLAMPVLARPVPELLRTAARAGVAVDPAAGPARTLLYRPGRRAVLRAGNVVLKAYAADADFRAGVDGLRTAGGAGLDAAPRLCGMLPELRLIVQAAIDGSPLPRLRAGAVAPIAGAMVRMLHDAPAGGLRIATPRTALAAAAGGAAVAAAVAPWLAERLRAAVARLEEHAPDSGALVPSHGDFNISQLLAVGGALAVLDFDEACLASPALDLAGYAANLVSGRAGDLARADAALDALVAGYGERPAHLGWHLAAGLLRRAASPFRRCKRGWPQRTAAIVAAVEEVLGR